MEKTAIIVPGEKQEGPKPYSIGFENILSLSSTLAEMISFSACFKAVSSSS